MVCSRWLSPTPAGADLTAYHEGGALNAAGHSSGRAAPLKAAWKATGLSGAVWSEPLVYRGLVIVATEENDVYAFRERTGARAWHVLSTQHLGHIGGELFSAPVCTSFGSDAYAAGTRFVACTEGIHALTIRSGAHRFARRWTGPSDANGPPILAAGRVW